VNPKDVCEKIDKYLRDGPTPSWDISCREILISCDVMLTEASAAIGYLMRKLDVAEAAVRAYSGTRPPILDGD